MGGDASAEVDRVPLGRCVAFSISSPRSEPAAQGSSADPRGPRDVVSNQELQATLTIPCTSRFQKLSSPLRDIGHALARYVGCACYRDVGE